MASRELVNADVTVLALAALLTLGASNVVSAERGTISGVVLYSLAAVTESIFKNSPETFPRVEEAEIAALEYSKRLG